jgi:hypothetical protein
MEVTMQTQSHPSLITVLVGALLALAIAAPAALAVPTSEPPVWPSAVPSQPGELTGPAADPTAARAQEAYYTSYGDPAPLTQAGVSVDDGGVDWAAIGIAVGATCLLIGAMIALVMRTRRRTGRVHVAA